MMSQPLLCVGLSPALQRTLHVPGWFAEGDVVRVSACKETVGGKATNAVRAIARAGGEALLLSPLGGERGGRVRDLLAAEGLSADWIDVAGETRICQTLLDAEGKRIRELVEPAPPLSLREWTEIFARLERALPFHAALLLCGSLPAGAPDDLPRRLCELAAAAGRISVLDLQGAMLMGALPAKPRLVKINRGELRASTGLSDIPAGMRSLLDAGARAVLITDGPATAWLAEGKNRWSFSLPAIDPVNPIGGGDTVTGVTALALTANPGDLCAAARQGLAAGLAQTLTSSPADFDPATAKALAEKIRIKKL